MEKSIHPMSNMFHGHIPFTADNLNGCLSPVSRLAHGLWLKCKCPVTNHMAMRSHDG